ncbi:MAG: hemin uptake protein HemP [Pseudomonadota bacterium]
MKQETLSVDDGSEIGPDHHLPIHAAEDLTDGTAKAIITLKDQRYTLHITKQGKLLLTK